MLKSERRILLLWAMLFVILRLVLFLPHREADWIGLVNTGLQVLLSLLCFSIFLKTRGARKFAALNFSLFFAFAVPLFLSPFIGSALFTGVHNAPFYYHFYVNKIGLHFLFIFPVCYVVFDFFLLHKSTTMKYLFSSMVSAIVIVILFGSLLISPLSLRNVPEYVRFQHLKSVSSSLEKELGRTPSQEEIGAAWVNEERVKDAGDPDPQREQISVLMQYLQGGGESVLFWRPVELRCIYAEIVALIIISVFLIASYMSHISYSAYFDKVLILFLAVTVLEMVHRIGYIQTTSQALYLSFFRIGEYFSIMILVVLAYVFDLRLRFSSSVTGRYYEAALEHSPGMITRWRDELDNLILRTFTRGKDPAGPHQFLN